MTSEVILYSMKYLRRHNVNLHCKFDQNRLMNEYSGKKKDKMPESQSFLVRYKRYCILKNYVS